MTPRDAIAPLPGSPARLRAQGSAYLIAIMVLLLLTGLGVAVSLVTQTEVTLASQERLIERTFYVAESGLELSIAQALAAGRFGALSHVAGRSELEPGAFMDVRERVESSPFWCLGEAPCNLCAINQGSRWVRRSHVVAADARRSELGRDGSETVLARKSLANAVDVEPVSTDLSCIADPAAAESWGDQPGARR